MKCTDCRTKEVMTLTRWERLKLRLFNRFHDEIIDLSQAEYTKGFGDGYKRGFGHADTAAQKAITELMASPSLIAGNWVVQTKDVLTAQNGKLYLGSDEIDSDTLKQLKAEVAALRNFKIWPLINETLRQKAIEKSVLNSTAFDQTLSGKLMVHCIGVWNSILDIIDRQNML